jgi:hypothetical protein
MAVKADVQVWATIHAERQALAADLEMLSQEQWARGVGADPGTGAGHDRP